MSFKSHQSPHGVCPPSPMWIFVVLVFFSEVKIMTLRNILLCSISKHISGQNKTLIWWFNKTQINWLIDLEFLNHNICIYSVEFLRFALSQIKYLRFCMDSENYCHCWISQHFHCLLFTSVLSSMINQIIIRKWYDSNFQWLKRILITLQEQTKRKYFFTYIFLKNIIIKND